MLGVRDRLDNVNPCGREAIMTTKIRISMTEEVRYGHDYSVDELSNLLDCEPTVEACMAALDAGNSTYGTADVSNTALLDDIVTHLIEIDERDWGIAQVEVDTASSASRQHHIDTGEYLAKGEAFDESQDIGAALNKRLDDLAEEFRSQKSDPA